MSTQPKILAFAGSTREGSFNKKLVRVAAEAARNAGAEVTLIDLKDYPMPLYDGDLEKEHGLPENAKKFMQLLIDHQGFLISSPEYNSSFSGVLKNSIDWASRPVPGMKPLAAFDGKVVCMVSASPGALGGLRGLFSLRSVLSNIKTIVLPEQLAISKANEAFSDDGKLKDEKQQAAIENIAKRLVEVTGKLSM
jgi:NAD(P)H-dependent FMN reductase